MDIELEPETTPTPLPVHSIAVSPLSIQEPPTGIINNKCLHQYNALRLVVDLVTLEGRRGAMQPGNRKGVAPHDHRDQFLELLQRNL